MIQLRTPRGLPVNVPQTSAEDPSPRFSLEESAAARAYYDQNGYVVIEGLVSPGVCDTARSHWDVEVKPSDRFIYRQATARAERHVINENGWIMNPILNLQSLDPRRFPRFREFVCREVLAGDALSAMFTALMDDRPKIVQSMYFEGNSATWEHQDTYYLDSENVGRMAAAWIALEDIEAQAGRFFVCAGSHRIDMGPHGIDNNIADRHDVYIESVVARIRGGGFEIRAPRLSKGDVLFWNARTVHGSLDSQDARHSRSSITCHAIPSGDRFLQLQMRAIDVPTTPLNAALVYRPKDQAIAGNRLILWIEGHFPGPFYWAKRAAIRMLAARRSVAAGAA